MQVQVFFCLVRPFIELDFCFKGVSVFVLVVGDDGRIDQTKEKEEENKMTQNEENAQGLMWINKKYFKSLKHHK